MATPKPKKNPAAQAEVTLADGMVDLLGWLEGQEAVDRVDEAARELAARGLTR